MKRFYLFFVLIMIAAGSCKKDNAAVVRDCEALTTALAEDDKEMAREKIDAVINALHLRSSATFAQQQEDMELFIAALNQCSNVDAQLLCLWCVETLPPQTEITVKFNYNGSSITRIIDLIQTDNGFKFANVHE